MNPRRRIPIKERFERLYIPEPNSGCWLWLGAINRGGYGLFDQGADKQAHRAAYRLFRGPIPEGLQIDHLCRNKPCVNPAHLEAVTPRENSLRAPRVRYRGEWTHCPRGHEYAGENLRGGNGKRRTCRACARVRDARNQKNRTERETSSARALKARVAALMQIIEEAPHDRTEIDGKSRTCSVNRGKPCDCWKAKAEVHK